MSQRRRNIVSRRRRVQDEGEEDGGSFAGELEDDSLSEGSVDSHLDDADVEGSEMSEDEDEPQSTQGEGESTSMAPAVKSAGNGVASKGLTDTEAMMNGLKLADGEAEKLEEIDVEDMGKGEGAEEEEEQATATRPVPTQPRQHRGETLAERKRREHEEYLKERDQNPAFVPTRGGFFLHDNRAAGGQWSNGHKPAGRGRGRASGPAGDDNGRRFAPKPEPSDGQWTHDLHEYVQQDAPAPNDHTNGNGNAYSGGPHKPLPYGPRGGPPAWSFSSSVLVGNVPVVVKLPGMPAPIHYSAVPKKQHTRLPNHRPPLRRDKPVRISLPDQPPRYIFPSTERSFIFIPRAMRPNQAMSRGRGRGGFYGSRRGSVYGGSTYSPSIAMSRRSSLGGMSRNGMNSPAGSVYSRAPTGPADPNKPVVRLPPAARQMHNSSVGPSVHGSPAPSAYGQSHQPYPVHANPAFRETRYHPLPMHQPRPQKNISVADIETPSRFPYNPPLQQPEQQPFHQQAAPPFQGQGYLSDPSGFQGHSRHPSHPSATTGTPLSQIPERAIHAQPFQPYSYPQPPAYYAAPYPTGAVYYPMPSAADYSGYAPPSGPSVAAPSFIPGAPTVNYSVQQPPQMPTGDQSGQANTVAHEANGMMYYYDSSQLYTGPAAGYDQAGYAAPPSGGVMGMGGMMTPPGGYYYPQPQAPVFYAPQ